MRYRLQTCRTRVEEIWKLSDTHARRLILNNKYESWALAKDEAKKAELDTVLYNLIESIRIISVLLIQPFMHHDITWYLEQIGLDEGEDSWEF